MITHKTCLPMNYATLNLKSNNYGYYDIAFRIMNLIYNRKFHHDYGFYVAQHCSISECLTSCSIG